MTQPGRSIDRSAAAVTTDGPHGPDIPRAPHPPVLDDAATVPPTRHRARHPTRPPARRPRLRRALLALVLVLVVVVGAAVRLALDAFRARDELAAAAAHVQDLQVEVVAGDRNASTRTLAEFQDHAADARAVTHGPLWSLAGAAPVLGPNVRAAQTVSEVVDDLATEALPALTQAASIVDPTTLAPVDGRVDLVPLEQAAPQVIAANAAVQAAVADLAAIDPGALADAVAGPVGALVAQVDSVAVTTATAARAVQLLPPMLGAAGPRVYLLLVQSNAELRATGGVPWIIVLRADGGAVEVVSTQSAGGALASLTEPVLPLTAQELALFGPGLGQYMADVTFTPDFPRSGELARALWARQIGGEVDGVLSIDPGALAHVLGATGPLTLATGQQLTADNATQVLLKTAYLEIPDNAEQDAFFAATARSVFDAVLVGQGAPAATVEALAQSAREGRLMVWSAHQDEQALLAGTVLSGELTGAHGDAPLVGVYLNDGTAAKLGYYLRPDVTAATTRCLPDGAQQLRVTVTLTSTAPANAAELPPWVSGAGIDLPKGVVQTNVLVYAPAGGWIDSVRVSEGDAGVFAQHHDGLAVAGKTIRLIPGQTITLEYDVTSGTGQLGQPVVRVTPTALGKVEPVERLRCR